MRAQYDLVEKPNPEGDGTPQPLYPRLVSNGKITNKQLLDEIAHASSFTVGDLEGMLELVSDRIAHYVGSGYSVEVGKIGYFRASLKATHAVMDKKDIRSTSIYIDKVIFRASKWLKQRAGGLLERSPLGLRKSADIGREKRLLRLNRHLDEHHYITRTEYSAITGLLKNKALEELKKLVAEGVLTQRGRGNQMVFVRRKVTED